MYFIVLHDIASIPTSVAKPSPFFGLNPILDPKFGLSQVGLALRDKNVSNWVRLASNRVQIWVQHYNVLSKPK